MQSDNLSNAIDKALEKRKEELALIKTHGQNVARETLSFLLTISLPRIGTVAEEKAAKIAALLATAELVISVAHNDYVYVAHNATSEITDEHIKLSINLRDSLLEAARLLDNDIKALTSAPEEERTEDGYSDEYNPEDDDPQY